MITSIMFVFVLAALAWIAAVFILAPPEENDSGKEDEVDRIHREIREGKWTEYTPNKRDETRKRTGT